ncbi:MAG TPA: response regulator [Thermoanaerobaculia bacterium]|nr:response regulator [Thermoanaerobaculia bacterium]
MKRSKWVLVVEDRDALRGLLRGGLEKRGFLVATAKDEEGARKKSGDLGEDLDVVLIDVELGRGGNGLDFGLWLKEEWQRQRRRLPEFLVYSAHEKPDYYQAAIQLGAAAYLRKGELGGDPDDPIPAPGKPPRIDRIAHHVKALALRRALRSDLPNETEGILEIARKSQSLDDARAGFCRDLLKPELEAILGGGFVLLATSRRRFFHSLGSQMDIEDSGLLRRIQTAVHGKLGALEPLVIDAQQDSWVRGLPAGEHGPATRALARLDRAAFIPLGDVEGGFLSLGLSSGVGAAEEPAADLAPILANYLTPTVMARWAELAGLWATIDMERRTLLRATSDFCLYQGQEMEGLLREAEEQGREQEGKVPLGKLHAVAQQLRSAGEMLSQVELLSDRAKVDAVSETIELKELLSYRWSSSLSGHLRLPDTAMMIEGSCTAEAPKVEVEKAVSQILFWLGRRLTRLPRNEEAPRSIQCRLGQDGGRAQVLLEEQTSRRMPKRMRDLLFAPFTPLPELGEEIADEALKGHRLGLYLARILAETVGGSLEEDSDAIPGSFGHRFVLQLPAAR